MPSLLSKWKKEERKTSSLSGEHTAALQSLESETGQKFGEVIETALDQFVIAEGIDHTAGNQNNEAPLR